MFKTLVLFAAIVFAASVSAQTQTIPPAASKKHLPTDTVGVVNGTLITLRDFRGELKRTMKDHMSEIPNGKVSDSLYTKFVNLTWEKMIGDILIEQEIKKLKLELSDGETIKRMIAHPPELLKQSFTDSTGKYFPQELSKFLNSKAADSLRDQVVHYYRLQFQYDGLVRTLAPKATTDVERKQAIDAWIAKRATRAEIDDRRPAFGFY
ncbi:MAG: SurA N-terminal domain-containing protein [Bacteroidetes bacterium]|nr:SurA N-terminal domain-containing protein [Bacteroidota bacterium]